MSGNPQEATTGLLSLAYYAKITVASAERSHADSAAVEDLLKNRFDAAHGAKVTSVVRELPPGGTERFIMGVTATANLDWWNSGIAPQSTGAEVAEELGRDLQRTDLSSVPGARIDDVELKLIVAG